MADASVTPMSPQTAPRESGVAGNDRDVIGDSWNSGSEREFTLGNNGHVVPMGVLDVNRTRSLQTISSKLTGLGYQARECHQSEESAIADIWEHSAFQLLLALRTN